MDRLTDDEHAQLRSKLLEWHKAVSSSEQLDPIDFLQDLLGPAICRRLGIYHLPENFLLSVVMPIYNEVHTVEQVIARVRACDVPCELILIDDGSNDGTRELLEKFRNDDDITLIFHERNQGKGAALKTGFLQAKGDVVVVQDADLEYDPADYSKLLQPIIENQADVVFGSRFTGGSHRVLYFWHAAGNRFLTLVSNVFTNLNLTDIETCYKMFRREVIQKIAPSLQECRFGIEPEITAKVARLPGVRIYSARSATRAGPTPRVRRSAGATVFARCGASSSTERGADARGPRSYNSPDLRSHFHARFASHLFPREVLVIVGVPKEIKRDEYRVAILPVGVEELVRGGHRVLIEAGAGLGSGLTDQAYADNGAELVATPAELFAAADMVLKVKEPLEAEWPLLRSGQIVFTYFHFAADRRLTEAVLSCGITAVAYETLRDGRGHLPLLTPMSEVAGRMSIQEGAKYLERPQMGRGILLGGVPGVAPAHITILGGGIVGANAAKVAAGFGADIGLLDINMDRLRYLDDIMPANVDVLFSDRHTIREQLQRADLVIGAVLIPGAKAPRLIEREDLAYDEARQRDHRRGDRPGRLRGHEPPHHAQRADVHRRRSRALLRHQHARRRGPHQHLCPVQRDAALGAGDRQPRHRARRRRNATGRRGHQRHGRRSDERSRGQDVRPAILQALCELSGELRCRRP